MIPALSLKKHPPRNLKLKTDDKTFSNPAFAIWPETPPRPPPKKRKEKKERRRKKNYFLFLRRSCTLTKEMCSNWFCGWPIAGRLDLALVTTRDWGWGRLRGGVVAPGGVDTTTCSSSKSRLQLTHPNCNKDTAATSGEGILQLKQHQVCKCKTDSCDSAQAGKTRGECFLHLYSYSPPPRFNTAAVTMPISHVKSPRWHHIPKKKFNP